MGRESRVRKPRTIKIDKAVTYATASELREQAALQHRAQRAGLVIPLRGHQLVELTDAHK